MFKFIYGWLVSLGERGVIGDGDEKENAEAGNLGSSQADADVGSADDSEGDQKAEELLQEEDSGGSEETTEEASEPKPVRDQAWWESRAKHFEGEYKRERVKRQDYDKKYGREGLASSLASRASSDRTNGEHRTETKTKKLDEIETASEFSEYILGEAKKQVRAELSEAQIQTRMVNSEKAAREEFDGEDGMPSYDDMFAKELEPFFQEHPDTLTILAKLDDPARAAYTLGLLRNPKYLSLLSKRQQSKAREDLTNKLDEATKKAVTIKNGKNVNLKSSRIAAAELEVGSDEHERQIAAAKDQ